MYEIGQLVTGNSKGGILGINEYSTCEILNIDAKGRIDVEIVMSEYENPYIGNRHLVEESNLGVIIDRGNAKSAQAINTDMETAVLLGLVK